MATCGAQLKFGGTCKKTLSRGESCPDSSNHKTGGNTNRTRAEDRNQSFDGEAHGMQNKKDGNSRPSGGGHSGR